MLVLAIILGFTVLKFLTGDASFEWGPAETVAVVVFVVALIVWKCTTDDMGVVMTTLAMVVAEFPIWINAYHQPG